MITKRKISSKGQVNTEMTSGHKKASFNFYKHGRRENGHRDDDDDDDDDDEDDDDDDDDDKISVRENAKCILVKEQSKLPRKEVKRIKK